MASSWKLDWDALPTFEQETVTREAIEAAARQSIFLQVESLDDPNIAPWLTERAIIRVDNAFDVDAQLARIALGMQLLQTDYPWIRSTDRTVRTPLIAFDPSAFDPSVLIEPGTRFLLEAGAPVFAWWTPPGPGTWEAALVTGNANERFGCLRAETDGTAVGTFEVCRTKVDADPTNPAGSPDWESASVRVTACTLTGCTSGVTPADPGGDLIGMTVDGACARALIAGSVSIDLMPQWVEISSTCFDAPLVRQGIARADDASTSTASLFVGVRRNGIEVSAIDVAGARVGTTDDLSRFVDLSAP
jgi:hypothetical protein